MFLKPTGEISEAERERGMRMVIHDGVMSQVMGTLTTGTFLIAYAVALGASNSFIGLLAAIPALAGLVQIFGIYIVERYRNRRAIAVIFAFAGRLLFLPIALAPFYFSPDTSLSILFGAFLGVALFGNISGCGWNSWMRDLIPSSKLGEFFSRRLAITTFFGMAASYAGAAFVDYFHAHISSVGAAGAAPYAILFAAGMLAGLAGVFFLARTPEPELPPGEGKVKLRALLAEPFKDENFRNMLRFLGSWNFAINLALPFFTVYMLTRLNFSITFIISLSLLTQILNIAFFQLWGKFADRFSNKAVFRICGPLFIFAILLWTFTTIPDIYFLTIPLVVLIHVIMGLAAAGVSLASSNMSLKLAPEGKATAYLTANSLVNSVAAGVAPLLGGGFIDFFEPRELSWVLTYITPDASFTFPTLYLEGWDFFFLFSFLIGLYSLHRLTLVQEVGPEADGKAARHFFLDFKNNVHDIPPLHYGIMLLGVPLSAITNIRRKIAGRKRTSL